MWPFRKREPEMPANVLGVRNNPSAFEMACPICNSMLAYRSGGKVIPCAHCGVFVRKYRGLDIATDTINDVYYSDVLDFIKRSKR